MYVRSIISIVLACLISMFFCLSTALAGDEIKITGITVASGRAYKVGDGGLKVGTTYYTDRAYVVNAMPKGLEGAAWIMTANDDKSSSGADFLKFTVDRPVVVWLAHDSRGEKEKGGVPPAWLSEDKGWTKYPDMTMDVTDTNMGFFILWSKEFDKGQIVLGGNVDPPAAGQGSNYLVLIMPGKKVAVEPLSKISTTWAGLKAGY